MTSFQARFTRVGYERLQKELEALRQQRGELRREIAEAREQGDLRENFAYHSAKDAQGMAEARIATLEARLADAIVVEDGEMFEEVVLGIPVTVRPSGTAGESDRVYTIVASEELEHHEEAASEESPIGQALLGKKIGEVATVQGPRGPVSFEIIQIGGA